MSRYCAEPSQGHDQQDETRVQSIHDFPVKAGFTGESDKFRSPSALARANAGFEAMAPCYGWRSPHTRGARGQALRRLGPRRIIPAYAGSTGPPPAETQRRLHHPRIRGEHDFARSKTSRRDQSSPHTRGALPDSQRHDPKGEDHPRIRGEHPSPWPASHHAEGSSPHTRGARKKRRKTPGRKRIIPAYAGSTNTAHTKGPTPPDHPRIRGEHVSMVRRCR